MNGWSEDDNTLLLEFLLRVQRLNKILLLPVVVPILIIYKVAVRFVVIE